MYFRTGKRAINILWLYLLSKGYCMTVQITQLGFIGNQNYTAAFGLKQKQALVRFL